MGHPSRDTTGDLCVWMSELLLLQEYLEERGVVASFVS
jgi:hypothetical protein